MARYKISKKRRKSREKNIWFVKYKEVKKSVKTKERGGPSSKVMVLDIYDVISLLSAACLPVNNFPWGNAPPLNFLLLHL